MNGKVRDQDHWWIIELDLRIEEEILVILFCIFHQVFLLFFMCKIFEDCCDTRGRRTDARKNITSTQMTHKSRAFGIVELRNCGIVLGELWNYGIVELWNNME